jgi:hypothetical protein
MTLENNGGGDDATANSLTSRDELIPSTKSAKDFCGLANY